MEGTKMRKLIRAAVAGVLSAVLISLPAVAQAGITFNAID
jgi:hypothetical protein